MKYVTCLSFQCRDVTVNADLWSVFLFLSGLHQDVWRTRWLPDLHGRRSAVTHSEGKLLHA